MKRIAVVNDLSGLGRCSLSAAIPIISALGIECCPLPTAVLSNQTGFNSFFCDDYTQKMDNYINEWEKLNLSFDAMLTGYLTSALQADKILAFIDKFKTDKTLLVVDPVMADDGRLYGTYNKSLCRKVAELVNKANIITPNLTELCILCHQSFTAVTSHSNEDGYTDMIAGMARTLISPTLKTVIVTGVKNRNCICNIAVGKDNITVAKSEIFGGSYSGTGDIFASIICAELVRGSSIMYSVELATRFLEKSIKDSYREDTDRNFGVNFQKYLGMLINE